MNRYCYIVAANETARRSAQSNLLYYEISLRINNSIQLYVFIILLVVRNNYNFFVFLYKSLFLNKNCRARTSCE